MKIQQTAHPASALIAILLIGACAADPPKKFGLIYQISPASKPPRTTEAAAPLNGISLRDAERLGEGSRGFQPTVWQMMDGLRRGATLETAPLAEPLAAQCLLVGTDPEEYYVHWAESWTNPRGNRSADTTTAFFDALGRSTHLPPSNHHDLPARLETAGCRQPEPARPALNLGNFPGIHFSHVFPSKAIHGGLKASHAMAMDEVCPSRRPLHPNQSLCV